VLGLPDNTGRLRVAGSTSPLTLPVSRKLGTLLVLPQRSPPWPERIPASRFGQLPDDSVDYTPTEPLLVIEADIDMCFDHHRWRHPTGTGGARPGWFCRHLVVRRGEGHLRDRAFVATRS